MKKNWIFIIVFAVGLLLAVALYFMRGYSADKGKKKQSKKVTLRRSDKNPYGCYLVYNSLPDLFKGSTIKVNKKSAYDLTQEADTTGKTAFILVSKYFEAGNYDMEYMVDFARSGNDVFLCASQWDSEALLELNLAMSGNFSDDFADAFSDLPLDTITTSLLPPVYGPQQAYHYTGRAFSCYISSYDSGYAERLGNEDGTKVNFIRLRVGKGNMFIHTEPACFTNLFMVTDGNYQYVEQALSSLNGNYKEVLWDEYYQSKRTEEHESAGDGKGSMLGSLLSVPPFRNAFWLLLGLALLYTLFEIKRKQRLLPVLEKPKNESLDFAKTMGRLYYEKGDNLNLSNKMSMYFLDYVRNRFKMSTSVLDDAFEQKLVARSGADAVIVNRIILFLRSLPQKTDLSSNELSFFYQTLETFYQQSK